MEERKSPKMGEDGSISFTCDGPSSGCSAFRQGGGAGPMVRKSLDVVDPQVSDTTEVRGAARGPQPSRPRRLLSRAGRPDQTTRGHHGLLWFELA